jgi:hypothetical protein
MAEAGGILLAKASNLLDDRVLRHDHSNSCSGVKMRGGAYPRAVHVCSILGNSIPLARCLPREGPDVRGKFLSISHPTRLPITGCGSGLRGGCDTTARPFRAASSVRWRRYSQTAVMSSLKRENKAWPARRASSTIGS